jgi:hypothetical protein
MVEALDTFRSRWKFPRYLCNLVILPKRKFYNNNSEHALKYQF